MHVSGSSSPPSVAPDRAEHARRTAAALSNSTQHRFDARSREMVDHTCGEENCLERMFT